MELFDKSVDPDLTVRRIVIVACGLIKEEDIPPKAPEQMSLFIDYDALEKQRKREAAQDDRERRLQEATLQLQERFGKNAVLKGMNLLKAGTTIIRNQQIGGHRSGDERTPHNQEKEKDSEDESRKGSEDT